MNSFSKFNLNNIKGIYTKALTGTGDNYELEIAISIASIPMGILVNEVDIDAIILAKNVIEKANHKYVNLPWIRERMLTKLDNAIKNKTNKKK